MSFGKDLLRKIKEVTLPGEHAHGVFSPPYRPVFTYDEVLSKNPKFAAVNIVLYLKTMNGISHSFKEQLMNTTDIVDRFLYREENGRKWIRIFLKLQ